MQCKSGNILEIAKEIFPGATDDEIDHILWEKTAFPLSNTIAIEQMENMAAYWKRMLGWERLEEEVGRLKKIMHIRCIDCHINPENRPLEREG